MAVRMKPFRALDCFDGSYIYFSLLFSPLTIKVIYVDEKTMQKKNQLLLHENYSQLESGLGLGFPYGAESSCEFDRYTFEFWIK